MGGKWHKGCTIPTLVTTELARLLNRLCTESRSNYSLWKRTSVWKVHPIQDWHCEVSVVLKECLFTKSACCLVYDFFTGRLGT